MKDNEKKVNATEEAKTEANGVELTDEELAKVNGGGFSPKEVLVL